jgi:hypothetical protein
LLHCTILAMGLGVAIMGSSSSQGVEPPSILKFFKVSKQSSALSSSDLLLKDQHGPWLILAASFEGEDAEAKATELANELRGNYKLLAYVLPKRFDYTKPVLGAGFDDKGEQKKMRYQEKREVTGFGVLVGDFDSLEHPQSKEALQRVKTIQPKCLTGQEDLNLKKWIPRSKDQAAQAGPMAGAFMTKNPLLPEEYFQPPKVDKFVQQLNQNAEFSLLKAKKNFTVRVAMFRGADSLYLDHNNPERKFEVTDKNQGLEKAAEHAHLAASILRKAGIEAYEFHDRNSSMVTVGSFESLGKIDEQGNFFYDNAIRTTVNQFGGIKEYRNSALGPVPVAKTLLDIVNYKDIPELKSGSEKEKLKLVKAYSIPFEIEPKAIAIPRPATNGLYSGSLLGSK